MSILTVDITNCLCT